MYQDEYEARGFPFRDFLLKLILIIIFALLLIWLLPKFIKPTVKNKCTNNDCVIKTSDKDFNASIKKMKKVATNYYTEEKLPKNNNEANKVTVQELIKENKIKELKNNNGNKYDYKNSYISIKKVEDEYLLKINLKIGTKENYKVYHLGHYSYCKEYLCKKKNKNNKKNTKPTAKVPIDNNNNEVAVTRNKNNKSTKKVLYEYKKVTGIRLSPWSNWSNWTAVDCSVKDLSCGDKDTNCLKEVKRKNINETNKTHTKSYTKTRNVLTKVDSYTTEACANNNYVIINNQTYITVGKWVLVERNKEFTVAPNDTERYRYEFVRANFSNCGDTCTTQPSYYYNVYKYEGSITKVANTKSTTSSSSCTSYKRVTIPVYKIIKTSEVASRTEPLNSTVCYQSIRTRSITYQGDIHKKWSEYNDTTLLNNNWNYTGNKKEVK